MVSLSEKVQDIVKIKNLYCGKEEGLFQNKETLFQKPVEKRKRFYEETSGNNNKKESIHRVIHNVDNLTK